ncbi:hypothetical protein LIPSTDRAFT_73485 [Lipomyces starkeyi NRRL Y-11557]|uniref:Transmembrane protein n=1 Tax=Lipomyces starkeyi NRRL Y-11557 TaxID=675824 RepID=A0A1E3Q2B3_LIPST|nr:hypothetical protein LIPSTDRAFT_73485 [Lipomyces starkeyi NRRL Y-11557]
MVVSGTVQEPATCGVAGFEKCFDIYGFLVVDLVFSIILRLCIIQTFPLFMIKLS